MSSWLFEAQPSCFRGPFARAFKPLYRHVFILLYFINWEIDQIEVKWHIEVNSKLLEEPGRRHPGLTYSYHSENLTYLQKVELAYECRRLIKKIVFFMRLSQAESQLTLSQLHFLSPCPKISILKSGLLLIFSFYLLQMLGI